MGNTYTQRVLFYMNAHRKTVRDLKWGGYGWIYSGSADQTIKVWSAKNGKLLYDIEFHTHWINSLTLSTDYILRTGYFNHLNNNLVKLEGSNDKAKQALYRYLEATKTMPERLVSGSDDTSMVIWAPNNNMIPNAKITGHQKPINYVCFSPDGAWLASASFDKSIKLWNGITGFIVATFLGHLAPVYICAWSPDSKYLVSASKDSILKIWEMNNKEVTENLKGHADEVYALDWSPDGSTIVSGGKDRTLKLWRH